MLSVQPFTVSNWQSYEQMERNILQIASFFQNKYSQGLIIKLQTEHGV